MPVTRARFRRPAVLTWTTYATTRALLLLQMFLTRRVGAVYPGDVGHDYLTVAREWTHGHVPYVDFPYEYPPGTLPIVKFAWVAGRHSPTGFLLAWVAVMLALDLSIVVVLHRWSPGEARAVRCWIVGVAAFGTTAYLRNDLQVVACTVAATAAFALRRPLASGLAWGAGTVTKLWPVVPLAALLSVWTGRRVRLAAGAGAVIGAVAVVQVASGAARATVSSLRATQGHRPIELETVWALPTFARALLHDRHTRAFYSFGSFNVRPVRAWVPGVAYDLSALVAVAALLVPAALWLVRRRRPDVPTLLWLFLAYTLAQVIVAPVLSPQYVLWALGAVSAVLCVERGRCVGAAAVLVVLACGTTQLVYPWLFDRLRAGRVDAVLVLAGRDAVLVAATAVAVLGTVRAGRRQPASRPDDPVPGGPALPALAP